MSSSRLPFFLLGSCLLSASACSDPADQTDQSDRREEFGTVQEPQKTICPVSGALATGIDVSKYQGKVDWSKVAGAGFDFAITRVNDTPNGVGTDPYFDQNWTGIKAAKLIRGAYAYILPGGDITAQASLVVQKVGKLGDGDLPVAADVELTSSSVSKTEYAAEVQQWIDIVKTGTGKTPLIYTGGPFWEGNVAASFPDNPLWQAEYPGSCAPPKSPPSCNVCPTHIPNQFSAWIIWQYTDAEPVAGISGGVDGDVFNGDINALRLLAGGGYGATIVSLNAPSTVLAGEKIAVQLVVKNTGGKAWDSNTKLGTTDPRDRMSDFADAAWLAPNRVAAVQGTVDDGDGYTFDFVLDGPTKPGVYTEDFGLLEETADATTWFGDAAGPPDEAISLQFQVVASPQGSSSAGGGGSGPGPGGVGGTGGSLSEGGAGGGKTSVKDSKCQCSTVGEASAPPIGLALGGLAIATALFLRRRPAR